MQDTLALASNFPKITVFVNSMYNNFAVTLSYFWSALLLCMQWVTYSYLIIITTPFPNKKYFKFKFQQVDMAPSKNFWKLLPGLN